MDLPGRVLAALDGEDVTAHVPLKGDDALYVTPTRAVVYRSTGLLSDESVETYSLDAEALDVRTGRRKATVRFEYGVDGSGEFTLPSSAVADALAPLLAGVLDAAGVTDDGESLRDVFRFGELTLLVTDDRVLKYIGPDVWATDHEDYPLDAVTGLEVEEGSVSSQVVLRVGDRAERVKTPSDNLRAVRASVEEALLDHHGFDTYEAFERAVAAESEPEPESASDEGADADADADGETGRDADATGGFGDSGVRPIEMRGELPGEEPSVDAESESAGRDGGEAAADTGAERPQAGVEPADPGRADETPDVVVNVEGRADAEVGDESGGEADPSDASGGLSASDRERLERRLDSLARTVERQQALIEEQQALVEELAAELSRDR